MSFVPVEDKKGYNWWMWVFVSPKTALFILDKRRSSQVPYAHFGQQANGIINCDRYSAYKKLTNLNGGLVKALCWAHFRRDFIDVGKSLPSLKSWADEWVEFIGYIYQLNNDRLDAQDNHLAFAKAQLKLEFVLEDMAQKCTDELKNANLNPLQQKVLESAQKNWGELTTFVHYVHVPMDNNLALSTGIYNPQDLQKTLVISGVSA